MFSGGGGGGGGGQRSTPAAFISGSDQVSIAVTRMASIGKYTDYSDIFCVFEIFYTAS
jgi:hypothetical protein